MAHSPPTQERHEAEMYAVDAIRDHDVDEDEYMREKSEITDLTSENAKLVVAMVGLPARGKSFIARKIKAYLIWRGLNVKVFNAGKYRRMVLKEDKPSCRADYFDTKNKEAAKQREKFAMMALSDMLKWFSEEGGDVGIFDATNTTRKRRANIVRVCKESKADVGIIFLESICDEEVVIDANIRSKVKTSPDFANMDHEEAIRDIKNRIVRYQSRYETVTEDHLSYIKLYNLQSRVLCNRLFGRIGKALLEYLMAIHIGSRRICLVRPGYSKSYSAGTTLLDHECEGKSAELSREGEKFAKHLGDYLRKLDAKQLKERMKIESCASLDESVGGPKSWDGRSLRNQHFKVMCSVLPIAMQTATIISDAHEQYGTLNPLHRGSAGRASLQQMKRRFPKIFEEFKRAPMTTRFPGGENYDDVRKRVKDCLIEIEQQPVGVIVVSHIAVLQLMISYFTGKDVTKCYKIRVPRHTAILLEPLQGGSYKQKMIKFNKDGAPREVTIQEIERAEKRKIWRCYTKIAGIILLPTIVLGAMGIGMFRWSRSNTR
ncbi:hypothetical protein AAMO2058_001034300 [Amorphochlora amoebiformis]